MDLPLSGGTVFHNGRLERADITVRNGRIAAVCPGDGPASGLLTAPGFVDVHVHFRQPGFEYKETVRTGARAAAAGGYTTVCAMPNLQPVPDSMDRLRPELDSIRRDACIQVLPYGSITRGELGAEVSDFDALAPFVAGFSDDGRGVQSRDVMRDAMRRAKALGKLIAAHCEDESLLPKGWTVHDGALSRRLGLVGNPPESEWKQVARDLELVRETGCQYHVCHVSTKESVALIRDAKREGLPVTCETAPHYLVLCDEDLTDDGRFKMNPPVRSAAHRDALRDGLRDGTIDCIATDHAPHSAAEKSGGLRDSLNGVVGLETAFPVLYTRLVKPGLLPLEILLRALCIRPREIFGLPGGYLREGDPADLVTLDLDREFVIDSAGFRSMGRAAPFDGWTVRGMVLRTVRAGETVYENPAARRESL